MGEETKAAALAKGLREVAAALRAQTSPEFRELAGACLALLGDEAAAELERLSSEVERLRDVADRLAAVRYECDELRSAVEAWDAKDGLQPFDSEEEDAVYHAVHKVLAAADGGPAQQAPSPAVLVVDASLSGVRCSVIDALAGYTGGPLPAGIATPLSPDEAAYIDELVQLAERRAAAARLFDDSVNLKAYGEQHLRMGVDPGPEPGLFGITLGPAMVDWCETPVRIAPGREEVASGPWVRDAMCPLPFTPEMVAAVIAGAEAEAVPDAVKAPGRLQPKGGGKIGRLRFDPFRDSAFGEGVVTVLPIKPSPFLDALRDACVNDPYPLRFAHLPAFDRRDTGHHALAEAQAARLRRLVLDAEREEDQRHKREQRIHAEIEAGRAQLRAKVAELRAERAAKEVPGPGARFTSPAELLRLGERPLVTADEGERSGWGTYDDD